MKEYNLYLELIYQMIDGETSEIERQTLFNAIQQYPELQLEFQNAININNAGKSYAASTEVPLVLTNQLFSKTGMNYTGSAILKDVSKVDGRAFAIRAKKGIGSGFGKSALSKYGYGVLGLILGGIFSFFIFGNSDIVSNQTSVNSLITVDSTKNNAVSMIDNTPLENNNNNQNINNYYPEDLIKTKAGILPEPDIINSNNSEISDQISDINQSNHNSDDKQPYDLLISDNITDNKLSLVEDNLLSYKPSFFYINSKNSNINSEHKVKFIIEINSSFFWNLPKETVSPYEINKLHNMNIFVYYLLNNYISFGIGARQETFYVKYNTSDELARNFIFEQQPNLTNFEISLRYNPFEFNNYDPFLQVNLGGGKFGYTYRVGIGSEIKIYENIAFTFFLEHATLMYNHRSETNYANKLGFNYGINYGF